MKRTAGNVLIDGASCFLSRSHGIDQQSRSMGKISRDKDAFRRGHERYWIYLGPAGAELCDVSPALIQERQIGRVSGGDQNSVTVRSRWLRCEQFLPERLLPTVTTQ